MAGHNSCMELIARVRGNGIECDWRLLPLCEPVAAPRPWPGLLGSVSSLAGYGHIDVIAYRDVKISARLMLWIEAVSVTVILIVVVLLLLRHGWHWDWDQLHLRGMTGSGVRLGLVLALFSFVGFESATTLGSEARNPLQAIPRAVIQSAILAGAFFTLCAYAEVLGFHTAGEDLGMSQAPMHVLARVAGSPILGALIDVGALVSYFLEVQLRCVQSHQHSELRYSDR
jgi:amino acid transporter